MRLLQRLPRFSVVFQAPTLVPEFTIVGGHQASLAPGRHNFVLTERKGSDMPDRTDRPSLVGRSVCLSTVLDDFDPAFFGKLQNRVHVAGPSG